MTEGKVEGDIKKQPLYNA